MFNPIEGGSLEKINNNDGYIFNCWIPPVGYGINIVTGALEKTDILKRSNIKSEQWWERTPLPDNWVQKRKIENQKKKIDPDYYDPQMRRFENQEWGRRLRGVWVWIRGKLVYLTGLHYFYLNWWMIDIGYPKFREPDRKVFYVAQYCFEDPSSAGIDEATKRRQGKTYRMACFIYEVISRSEESLGGLQSKTGLSVKNEVFRKSLVSPFKKLPDFFIPVFDESKGITPTSELRFAHTTKKGKNANENIDKPELNSVIDHRSSNKFAYDGTKLLAYGSDESGKTEEEDIYERHEVVKYCLETDAEWTGKAWYTTTVEEMKSGGKPFMRLWKASDPRKRDENGHTITGLYNYFTPAYETLFDKQFKYCDKYGYPKVEEAKIYFMNRRAALVNDGRALSSEIRKNPFTVVEMFRIDGEKCLFNPDKLNARLDYLSWNVVTERGNYEWKDNIRDSSVIWVKTPTGRWERPLGYEFKEMNNTIKRGNHFYPGNKLTKISGVDPYDHDITEDGRFSNAASFVLNKYDPNNIESPFNKAFISKYCWRQPMAPMMYEDMIMQSFYYGSPILYESNKPGIKRYFCERGYSAFLVHLSGYKEPGIPATPDNKQALVEVSEEYIETNSENVFFSSLILDWLNFDIKNTQPSDETMGAGWTLVGNMRVAAINPNAGKRQITEYIRQYTA